MGKGYIYIMTNPAFPGKVKIGYATDVEVRRQQFNTASPDEFEVYATYEVNGEKSEKSFHKLIDKLNDKLRYKQIKKDGKINKREFFDIQPEFAYEIMALVAETSGTIGKLDLKRKTVKKASNCKFSFSKINIKPGTIINFRRNTKFKCKVLDDKYVEYNGKKYSLSKLASELLEKIENKKWKSIQGPDFFVYKGKTLWQLRKEIGK